MVECWCGHIVVGEVRTGCAGSRRQDLLYGQGRGVDDPYLLPACYLPTCRHLPGPLPSPLLTDNLLLTTPRY